MNKKSKIIILLISIFFLIFSVGLVACGDGDGEGSGNGGGDQTGDGNGDGDGDGEDINVEGDGDGDGDGEDINIEGDGDGDGELVEPVETKESNVPRPEAIEGTVINERPILYKEGVPGGRYVISMMGDFKTWNDSQSSDTSSSNMISRMQISVFDLDYDTGKWYVQLGDRTKGSYGEGYDMNVNDDGTMEIVIYLRDDIYWTDGTRLTADDFVYYWNDITRNEDVGSQAYGGTFLEVDGEEKPIVAEKVDKFTYKFVYPTTMGDPELPISGGCMPKHILKPIMDSEGPDGVRQMWGIDTPLSEIIGYGPWVPENYSQGESMTFKKNDRYFLKDEWNNNLPYLDQIVYLSVSDMNSSVLKFKNQELDMVSFPNSSFKDMVEGAEAGGYSVWNGGPAAGTLFVTFNQNPNSEKMKGTAKLRWFQDKRFRQAMNYLIDKESLIDKVLNGLGEPDKGFLHPASKYFNPDIQFPNEYNPDKALALLEEMGIRDRNGDSILEDEDNNNIEFELVTNTGNNQREKTMSIISANWNAYGVKSIPITIEFNVLVDQLLNNYNWESMVMALSGGVWPTSGQNVWLSSADLHFWHPRQEEPATEWEAEVDRIFNTARNEPDLIKRKALWDQMYTILYDQLPQINLFRQYSFLAIYDKWENVNWDIFAGVGGNNTQRLFLRQ